MLTCEIYCGFALFGVIILSKVLPPPDLEVIRTGLSYKMYKRVQCIMMNIWRRNIFISTVGKNRKVLDGVINTKLQNRWNKSTTARIIYEYIKDVTFVVKHSYIKLDITLSLLIGHGSLNTFFA